MFAWRAHEYGPYRQVLKREEVDDPEVPRAGVVIDVGAVGLNFFDILSIAGQYQVKAPLPFVPGTEAAGRVVAVGSNSKYQVGQRLLISNIVGACADKMAAPDFGCFPIPDTMPDEHAAAILIVYQTAYFALKHRARLTEGETLLVHGGAGAVGTAAIQIGKLMGAKVIATASTDEKLSVCRGCGADHLINYRDADFVAEVKKLTSGRGANVIFDPVGGDVFDKSTKCIAWEGRLVVIGFAQGRIPEIKANRILLKNMAVVGLNWGGYQMQGPEKIRAAHDELCRLHTERRISPVVWTECGLQELPEALDAIVARRTLGKVVLHR